jgi:hypothetical protein
MAHHHSSLFADIDYDEARSTSTYSAQGSSRYTSASHSRVASSQALGEEPQYPVRKQTSLAQIVVPSFSAFRSQTSSIPVVSPSGVKRKQLPLQSHSPRAPSLAEIPSPRLADPGVRPWSLDSPLHHQSSGLANEVSQSSAEVSPLKRDNR